MSSWHKNYTNGWTQTSKYQRGLLKKYKVGLTKRNLDCSFGLFLSLPDATFRRVPGSMGLPRCFPPAHSSEGGSPVSKNKAARCASFFMCWTPACAGMSGWRRAAGERIPRPQPALSKFNILNLAPALPGRRMMRMSERAGSRHDGRRPSPFPARRTIVRRAYKDMHSQRPGS